MSDLFIAVILGIVQGLTEYLPVSSTGHMLLVGELLGFVGERAGTFEIFIQLGSILAVLWLYRGRFLDLAKNNLQGKKVFPTRGERTFTLAHLAVACAPAFVLGAALHSFIKHNLFSARTVLIGLVVGGVVMILAEWVASRFHGQGQTDDLDHVSLSQALACGCLQCLSLWPGFSRSGSTISGGLFVGLSRRTAAEFSFFVAVPIMLAATLFDLIKSWHLVNSDFSMMLLVGSVVSFIVAWIAVVGFLRFVQQVSLTWFAVYRFVVAMIFALVAMP